MAFASPAVMGAVTEAVIAMAIALLISGICAFSFAPSAFADDSAALLAQKQSEADAATATLTSLSEDLECAGEDLAQIQQQQSDLKSQIDSTQQQIDYTTLQVEASKQQLADRVRNTYKSDDSRYLGVLLNSTDFTDFVSNVLMVEKLNESDVAAISQYQSLKSSLESQKTQLEDELAQQDQLAADAQAKNDRISSSLDAQKELLDSLDSDVAALVTDGFAQQAAQQEAVVAALAQSDTTATGQTTGASQQTGASSTPDGATTTGGTSTGTSTGTITDAPATDGDTTGGDQAGDQTPDDQTGNDGNASDGNTTDGGTTDGTDDTSYSYGIYRSFDGNLGYANSSVVDIAMQYLGCAYVWGATGEWSDDYSCQVFDCSGFTQYCYAQAGIDIPRTSRSQFWYQDGYIPPDRTDLLEPGDLVFFGSDGSQDAIHHVGIYIGGGEYIHAPQTGDVVKISYLFGSSEYVGAIRV